MKSARVIAILFGLTSAVAAHGYELATHGRLTYNAYLQSVLAKDDTLLKDLGLKIENPLADEPFGPAYYDFTNSEVRTRQADPFESSNGKMPTGPRPLSLPGWLLRGAIREDDYLNHSFPCRIDAPNPQDDPYPDPPDRPLSHFYDPVFDRQLTLSQPFNALLAHRQKAPDWATGAIDAFDQPNEPNVSRRNHFTVLDAREAMYRALAGKNKENTDAAKTKEERDRYWATSVRALGDIVHLIQDMAVPHHTRNDPHSGSCFPAVSGHASVFENYIEARATQSQDTKERTQALDPTFTAFPNLDYGNYPVPRFVKYADIFSTAPRDGVEGGFGLADYSNRGFFSAGTNLGDNDFPQPPNDRHQFAEQVVNVDSDTKTSYLLDGVFDTLNPGLRALDVPKTKEGVWYEPLLEFADTGVAEKFGYSLDQRIYDAQAGLLIPRAVAYSAGLIDYFFRGRLEAVDPTFTDEGVSLKVKNAIDRNKVPEWASEHLYREDSQGNPSRFALTLRYKQDKAEKLVASDPVTLKAQSLIAPGVTSFETLTFDLQPPPDDATDVEYRLVFRGRLGAEDDAIAVGIVEPVSGFIVNPNYVPADGISGSRLIVKTKGKWQLATQRNLQAHHIDWKGWYVRGRPTKVLTYSGPVARYFPELFTNTFGSSIFQSGELFARTLCPILGAAITKDAAGKEWLVAVCKEGLDDVVYRRENVKDTSSSGWEEIGRIPVQPGASEADVPWFFNGNGTEAQTMRLSPRTIDGVFMPAWRDRYKLTITNATSVQFENLENEFGVRTETLDQTCNVSAILSTGTQHRTQHADVHSVVAVDYVDGNEILGYWRLNTSSDQYNQVSAGPQLFAEKADGNTKRSLIWRNNEIVLNDFVLHIDNLRVGLSYPAIEGQVLTRRKEQFGKVIYWDMREDLLIYSTAIHETKQDSGGVVAGGSAVQHETIDSQESTFWHKGEIETIYKDVSTTEFVDPDGCCGGTGVCESAPFDSGTFTITVTVHPGAAGSDSRYDLAGIFGRRFSAAADSGGNVFVSMIYADKDDVRHWFNFLTGGDPTEIIPGATSDPRYWPVYVAK
jgi:hypothetical protein